MLTQCLTLHLSLPPAADFSQLVNGPEHWITEIESILLALPPSRSLCSALSVFEWMNLFLCRQLCSWRNSNSFHRPKSDILIKSGAHVCVFFLLSSMYFPLFFFSFPRCFRNGYVCNFLIRSLGIPIQNVQAIWLKQLSWYLTQVFTDKKNKVTYIIKVNWCQFGNNKQIPF